MGETPDGGCGGRRRKNGGNCRVTENSGSKQCSGGTPLLSMNSSQCRRIVTRYPTDGYSSSRTRNYYFVIYALVYGYIRSGCEDGIPWHITRNCRFCGPRVSRKQTRYMEQPEEFKHGGNQRDRVCKLINSLRAETVPRDLEHTCPG